MTGIVLVVVALYLLTREMSANAGPASSIAAAPQIFDPSGLIESGFTDPVFGCGPTRFVSAGAQVLGRSTTGNPPTGPQNHQRQTVEAGSRAVDTLCVTDPGGVIYQVFVDQASGRVVGFR